MKSGKEIARSKAEARERKLKTIRARNRNRILLVVSLAVAAVLGSQLLYNSHFFDLAKIEVRGVSHLKKSEVVESSGAAVGQNLLKLDVGAVKERVEKNPWVRSAAISRRLLKTLVITVTERKPFAVILTKKGFYYIDEEGYVIEQLKDGSSSSLPKIADIVLNVKPGDKASSAALDNAIKCLKGLDPWLKSRIVTLSVSTPDRLLLYTRDNIEILYGRAEEMDKKNQVIKAILAQKKGKPIFMDVRTVANPIVKRLDTSIEQ